MHACVFGSPYATYAILAAVRLEGSPHSCSCWLPLLFQAVRRHGSPGTKLAAVLVVSSPRPQRIIDAFQMDQCLIFCRTNFDCDNLEKFLNSLGELLAVADLIASSSGLCCMPFAGPSLALHP